MPNFRGSTGFGKQFLDAGNKQWGDKMQDDITWGVKYLVDQGITDPKRVGIWGGRHQPSMTTEVAERLKVLTVNVKEVNLATTTKP